MKGVRGSNSWVWQFFTRANKESRLAKCNVCKQTYNCMTTSNLKQHLDSMHPTTSDEQMDPNQSVQADADYVPSESNASDDESLGHVKKELLENDADALSPPVKMKRMRSFVWKYMKVVKHTGRRTVVECSLCLRNMTTINSSTTNLISHLRTCHPDHIDESSHDSYVPVPTNTERLPKKKRKRRRSSRASHAHGADDEEMQTFYLDDNLDTQEEDHLLYVSPSPRQHNKNAALGSPPEDSLNPMEHFGRYATSLLRQLPSETAYRLQADFIYTIVKHIEEKANDTKPTSANTDS